MSTAFMIHDHSMAYFITLTIVKWMPVFYYKGEKLMIIDSLKYATHNKGLIIYAYCIMSNHIHMVCRATERNSLTEILRDLKSYTSKRIILSLQNNKGKHPQLSLDTFKKEAIKHRKNQEFAVWQRGYRAIEVSSNKFIDQKINYIHNNPVKAGLVKNCEDYMFSSARNYAGLPNCMDAEISFGKWKAY